jgi:hypothetical protein
MRVAVRREMLGAREQAWSIWTGKDVQEYTGNQIKNLIRNGNRVYGLRVSQSGELELDKEGFFTTNIMEHRYCGNFEPMVEDDSMANLFYTVIGKVEEAGAVYYECISSKFEHTKLTEADVRAYLKIGVIASGAKLEGDKILTVTIEEQETVKPEVKSEKKVEVKPEVKTVPVKEEVKPVPKKTEIEKKK